MRFANTLAAALLCEAPTPDGLACGNCKQCKLLAAQTHSDLRVLEPEEGSATIKIDAIRNLVDFVGQTSLQGGLKVAILHPVEALTLNAANALLKTLEEPADKSIILLVSHSAGQLLPTIRSRCQRIDFGAPAPESARQWLVSQIQAQSGELTRDQDLNSLLDLASGAPIKAKEYASLNALQENMAMLDELAAVLKKDLLCSPVAERWSDDLFAVRLAWSIRWLEKIIQFKMAGLMTSLEGQHGEKMMAYLADRCSEHALFELHRESLSQYRLALGASNPNKQLVFESLLNGWLRLMTNAKAQVK